MRRLLVFFLIFAFLPLYAVENPDRRILFTGSSTIAIWANRLTRDFPGEDIVTEARGGTDFRWLIKTLPAAMKKYRPGRVVIYSGDNDLAAKDSPETVARNFRKVVGLIRLVRPRAVIFVLSVKPAPGRRELLPQVRETNALLSAAAKSLRDVHFVDVFTPMISADGVIDAKNFDPQDAMNIHLSSEGYDLWAQILRESMKRAP